MSDIQDIWYVTRRLRADLEDTEGQQSAIYINYQDKPLNN